jgi:hypothetical protein
MQATMKLEAAGSFPVNIILDDRQIAPGHKLAWRRGRIIGEAQSDSSASIATARFERRGRERKHPESSMPRAWLLKRSPEVETKLDEVGLLVGLDDA